MSDVEQHEVVIIGAGAAGLMCAASAGQRGRDVLVVDHARKPGNKIRMSGGGKCNFTNHSVDAENYLSHNPHFCKSALHRYTQWDFIALVDKHGIPFHERDHGQLFCDNSSKDILDMLLAECEQAGTAIRLGVEVEAIERLEAGGFILTTSQGVLACESLVIASGGQSIPTMGASPFGYKVAEQFGIRVWPPSAGLAPFTLRPDDKSRFAPLSGIAVDSRVSNELASFRENILFTHRGLSGPAILQISNYWQPGESVTIDLLPAIDLLPVLVEQQRAGVGKKLRTLLSAHLPKRLVDRFIDGQLLAMGLQDIPLATLQSVVQQFKAWKLTPNGSEGYRTAEVTRGGVDCDALSSKTLAAREIPDLFFIGEVVDVTGWLGGYNFQWAWSSGWCAGQYV